MIYPEHNLLPGTAQPKNPRTIPASSVADELLCTISLTFLNPLMIIILDFYVLIIFRTADALTLIHLRLGRPL